MFITFEGPEGSGKSTQIRLLADYLRENGQSVIATREPGGTAIGDQIRACLHDVGNTAMTAAAEILLYSASRAQLVAELIRPALAAGQIILCDRYADSTMAYQGYGRGLNKDDLAHITQFATGGLQPDLTFLLDISVERGLQRRLQNGQEMNRMDRQTLAFYERVRQGYYELAGANDGRWVILDGDRPVEAVQADLRRITSERLGEKR
jgi:dTMP kinase